MSLTWNASAGATEYVIQYRKSGDTTWTSGQTVTTNTATVGSLLADTNYEFQVRAKNTGGESAWSNLTTGKTSATVVNPPAAPTNFLSTGKTENSVLLAWDAVNDATGYEIQYRIGTGGWTQITGISETIRTITNLIAGITYEFQVRAVKGVEKSAWTPTPPLSVKTSDASTPGGTITEAEFLAIKSMYADLNLTNYGDYNIIEITAAQLSDANLRNAISVAASTTKNDLIVARTTTTQNTIMLGGTELAINIDSATYGSVTIVSLGAENLTIDANEESRVFNLTSSDVALAGLTITHGQTSGSGTSNYGGGIYSNSTLTVTNCTISDNFSDTGGGIYNCGTLTVTNSTISGNSTGVNGGGLYNYEGIMTLTNCIIAENSAGTDWYGGGIFNTISGIVTISNCTVTKNSAHSGGGIDNVGTLIVQNSTILGNTSRVNGGGLYNSQGDMTLTNCVIAENSAGTDWYGGGIANSADGILTITNCTITRNSSARFGAIYNCGTLTINNSIVAGNFASYSPDIYHDLTYNTTISGRNNLIGNGEGQNSLVNGINGNIVGTTISPIDPRFTNPGQGNYRLAADSPAINKGSNALAVDANGNLLLVDLDGNARIFGGMVDIGAYEYHLHDSEEKPPFQLPANLRIEQQAKTTLTLNWGYVADAAQYELQRKGPGDAGFVTVYTGVEPRYVDTGLTVDTTYEYRVRAISQAGSSAFCESIVAKTLNDSVTDVPMVTASGIENGTATLQWEPLGPDYVYSVYRNGVLIASNLTESEFIDTPPGTTSKYVIYAINTTLQRNHLSSSLPVIISVSTVKPEITGHELTEQGGLTLHWSIAGAANAYVTVYRNGIAVSSPFIGNSWTDTSPRSDVPNQYSIYVTTQAARPESVWSSTYVVDTSSTLAGIHAFNTMMTQFSSGDINEIVCPVGYGFDAYNAGTEEEPNLVITSPNWITDNRDQTNSVYFENKPSATIVAHEVSVSMQMPAEWDWSTFTFYEICIGTQVFTQMAGDSDGTWLLYQAETGKQIQLTLTYDAETGYVHWYMKSTTDDGFLPPNDATHCGEGYIKFGIRMKDNLATGTVVESFANIALDANASIITNVWKNTIDADVPESSVQLLPDVTTTNRFLVSWAGTDVGSGVGYYDIYVSVDGGDYAIWQKRTTETSAFFEGENGKTYAFVSIATDNVGQAEVFPNVADAITTLDVAPIGEKITRTVDMTNTGSINEWTIRKNGENIEVTDAANEVIFTQPIGTFNHLVINASNTACDTLTIDFSHGGAFLLAYGIEFNGSANHESLAIIGSDGDDILQININATELNYGGLPIYLSSIEQVNIDGREGTDQVWMIGSDGDDKFTFNENGEATLTTPDMVYTTVNMNEIFVDVLGGNDKATIIGSETNGVYSMGDNSFVMQAGGYRVDLRGFNRIDVFADGHRDKAYVYGQNNSLIFMNDQYVECRGEGQAYRIWRSEQIIAINMDDTNNAIIHSGSRSFDSYTIAENYGSVTNANGSYFHEWFDFTVVNIASQTASVSLPGRTGDASWSELNDSKIWQQNGTSVTILGDANVSFRGLGFSSEEKPQNALPTLTQALSQTEDENRAAIVQSDTTTSPVWSYASSQTTIDQQIVPNMDLVSPTQLFDANEQITIPVAITASIDVTQSTAITSSNSALFTEDELLYAWLAEEQYQANKKKLSEIFDDTDNWLEDFEEFALRELRK